MAFRTRTILLILALAGPAPAQRTWIVDAKGGGDFTDIQPAFDRASAGDTILVRAGSYEPARTSKGLRVLGETGAFIAKYPPQPDLLVVHDLRADETFVMKGLLLETINAGSRSAMKLVGNKGRVHLEGLTLRGIPYSNRGSPALSIESCAQVSLIGSNLVGEPALGVAGSTLSITNSVLQGQNAHELRGMYSWRSYYAIVASSARVGVTGSIVRGGSGTTRISGSWEASPAALFTSCRTTLRGDASALFAAGTPPPNGAATPAIVGTGGTLLVDPSVPIVPAGNAPPIRGNVGITRRRLPALRITGGSDAGAWTTDLYAQAGHGQVLFVSAPAHFVELSLGVLWLDLRFLVPLDAGIVGGRQHVIRRIPIPPDPRLRGATVAFQVLSGTIPTPVLELSNPVIPILD